MKKILFLLLAWYTPVSTADFFYPYNMPWNWFDDGGKHGISQDYLPPIVYDYPLPQGGYDSYYPYAQSPPLKAPPFQQQPRFWHQNPYAQPVAPKR
jgi:hypothetical protein